MARVQVSIFHSLSPPGFMGSNPARCSRNSEGTVPLSTKHSSPWMAPKWSLLPQTGLSRQGTLEQNGKKKSRDETQTKRASLLLIGVGREDMRLPDVLSPSRIKHPTRAPSWGQCSRSGPKKSGRGACVQQVINSVCHEPEGPGLFARLFSQSLVSLFFLLRASHHQIWEKIYMK